MTAIWLIFRQTKLFSVSIGFLLVLFLAEIMSLADSHSLVAANSTKSLAFLDNPKQIIFPLELPQPLFCINSCKVLLKVEKKKQTRLCRMSLDQVKAGREAHHTV